MKQENENKQRDGEVRPFDALVMCTDGKNGAVLSKCENYRYKLWRVWNDNKATVLFIMLNPSTADAENNDPTIRRCIGYAKEWGYGGLYVGNLYAYRATKPENLFAAEQPEGEANRRCIKEMADKCELVICAWGNGKGKPPKWMKNITELHYLKQNKDGTPSHPLYLPKKLKPIGYKYT